MRKIICLGLFALVLVGAYGQVRNENRWLVGTWTETEADRIWVFKADGSGQLEDWSFNFSIEQTSEGMVLSVFYDDGEFWEYIIRRISDRQVVLRSIHPTRGTFNLTR
jgi:hypothetical protein